MRRLGDLSYFFPSLSPHTGDLVGVTFAASIVSSLLFGRSFLSSRVHAPRLDIFLRVCVGAAGGYAVLLFPVLILGTE